MQILEQLACTRRYAAVSSRQNTLFTAWGVFLMLKALNYSNLV